MFILLVDHKKNNNKQIQLHNYTVNISRTVYINYILIYVTLEHKNGLKSLEYIYSNSQKYIVWVKIIEKNIK